MNSNPTDTTQSNHGQFEWWDTLPVNAPGTPPSHPMGIPQTPEGIFVFLQQPPASGPDQQGALPTNTAAGGDHLADVGVGIDPSILETPPGSSRRRWRDPRKRRELNSSKSRLIGQLRDALELPQKITQAQVLNAAIERLGGILPREDAGKREKLKWVYDELHKLSRKQGKLNHVRCLEWAINQVKGNGDALEIIFEGQPSGSSG